jgi:oxygen-independent coproporphyrinogen-3 oxidase
VIEAQNCGDEAPSLYIHVPFCASKCDYCAFYSEAADGDRVNRYVSALVREMEMVANTGLAAPKTVFFGGGTPSLLNLRQWEVILGAMERLGLSKPQEWTIECNPATVSLDKARLWRERGVNRLSMGVQSLNADMLERLGRVHSREAVFRSFDTLRQAGFDNLNIDLMFAIPGQSMAMWRQTMTEATALGSEHLSCYEVIYEEDTPLFAQLQAGEAVEDEDLACAMHEELLDFAAARGFEQYEVANFARRDEAIGEFPGRACRHNLNYWRGGECFALGPSAAGHVAGARTRNWANTGMYCEMLENGVLPIELTEKLSPLAKAGELAAFGLRLNQGWPVELFESLTGYALRVEWREEISRLTGLGYAEDQDGRFRLTRTGLRYADWAAELFLRPEAGILPCQSGRTMDFASAGDIPDRAAASRSAGRSA